MRGDLIILLRCVYDIGPFQAKLITAAIYPCPADGRRVTDCTRTLFNHLPLPPPLPFSSSAPFPSHLRSISPSRVNDIGRILTFEQIPIVLIAARCFAGRTTTLRPAQCSSSWGMSELISIHFSFDGGNSMLADKRGVTASD